MFLGAITTLLIDAQSCGSDDNDGPAPEDFQNGIANKSFTYEFQSDSPYDRTYDLAFIDDNFFEFTATAHGTTGETFGNLVDTYTVDGDNITFDYGGRGFNVNSSYVKPVSATVIYMDEEKKKIDHLAVKLKYETYKGKVSYSTLEFYVSDYKPQTTITKPHLTEADFKGTIWEYGNSYIFLYKDKTTSLKYNWTFDEKKQTMFLSDPEGDETREFRIISGDTDEFLCKDGTEWEKYTFSDYTGGWLDSFLAGKWINEKGETLEISAYDIGGTLAPDLPQDTKRRKYKLQYLRFSGQEQGRYYIRYEGEEMDVTDFIPMAWDTQKGGNYQVTDIFSSRYSVKLKLSGLFSGTFTRQHN